MNKKNQILDELFSKIMNFIPEKIHNFNNEFENNLKTLLNTSFERLELVTREEFDIQKEVLLKTRKKLDYLERKINELVSEEDLD